MEATTTTRTVTLSGITFEFDITGTDEWTKGNFTIVRLGQSDYRIKDDSGRRNARSAKTFKAAAVVVLEMRAEEF